MKLLFNRSLLLSFLFCFVCARSFGTVTTIWSTGTASSFTSGNIAAISSGTGTLTRNDNYIVVQDYRTTSTTLASNKGYAVFDLSSIPAGSTITSVTLGWFDSAVVGSHSSTTTYAVYGYPGDLSKMTSVQALNNAMENTLAANSAFALYSTTATTGFGTSISNNTATLTNPFFATYTGSKISICWTMASNTASNTAIHYIIGERGNTTTTTTNYHAPYMTVTYTAPGTCSGSPASATSSATPAYGNSTTTHLLRLSGSTTASNLTFQWQSSPTGTSSWTDISGATTPTWTFTGVSAVTYYRCNVGCGASVTASSVSSVGLMTASSCTPTYSNAYYARAWAGTTYYWGNMTIAPIIFSGGGGTSLIDSTAASGTSYADHTDDIYCQGLRLFKSNTYNISMRSGLNIPQNVQVWIDYDNNGAFASSESIGGGALATGATVYNFTTSAISSSVATGSYRMRIRSTYSSPAYPSIDPCTGYTYGDCRDYLVAISDPPPGATATPSSLSFTTSFGPTTVGSTSPALSSAVNATFLLPASGTITVTAPANFTVCSTSTGSYVSSYTISYSSATSTSTVFVKFSPSAVTSYSGNVTITGGGIASAVNIPVSGNGSSACSGTPTAGTAAASPASGNSTYTFTLTCAGFTASGGMQFNWQSSPDSTSWSDISGASTAVYTFTGITSSTYYRCRVTCSGSGSSANTFAAYIQYFSPSSCTPTWSSAPGSYTVGIATNPFKVNGASGTTIVDNAAPSAGYVDNSATMGCTLNTGTAYTFTAGSSSTPPMSYQVWIDFSNDGVFQTSESVGGANVNGSTTPTFIVNIPAASSAITSGYYRMRVEADQYYHAYPGLLPCPNGSSTLNYNGEVRDYKVRIIAVPYATATPSSILFPPTVPGTYSGIVNATFSASYLSPAAGNITVTAPANFLVFNGSAWVTSYTISYTSSTVTPTTVPVYFGPGATGTFTGVNVTFTGGGITTQNVAVSGVGAAVCSGTPAAGTVTASPSGGGASTNFTLSCTGYSASGGIQFQWQSSGDSSTWSNISGATLANYSYTGTSSNTYYRCNVTCSASSVTTPTPALLVPYITPSSCTPNWQYGPYYYTVGTATSPFKLTGSTGSINDNSTPSSGYVDNTAIYGCTLIAGNTYTVTVGNPGTTGFGYQIWLDFNNDGVFQTSEKVGGMASTTAVAQTIPIVIPSGSTSITPGVYRMRVESETSGSHAYPNLLPCPNGSSTSNSQGEVRDYRITLQVNPTPIVSPTTILFPPTTVGSSSPTVNVNFSAMYLAPAVGNITVTAPANFQVYNGTAWVTTYAIGYTANTVGATTIPVQFNPTAATTYSGTNVTITGGGLTTINIAVSGTGAAVCSGTPTAGTASCSPLYGNSSTSFTLTCSGYSAAGGIQFQWQSSSDSSTWSNISGATLANYTFTGFTSNKYYQCIVTCSASSLSATAATGLIRYLAPSSCTPSWYSPGSNNTYSLGNATNGFKITGSAGSIVDATAANATGLGYTDNTATLGCTLNAGSTYTVSTGSSTTGMSFQVWIDFNNDGTFQSTESVGGIAGSTSTTQTFTITIPTGSASIAQGVYRMRAMSEYSGAGAPAYPSQNPCPPGTTPYYYGDVRDYKITLFVPPFATVSPTSLTFSPTTITTSSAAQTVSLTGSYLSPSSGNLTVTAPTGYYVSSTTSGYASSYTYSYTGSASSSTIYAIFSPTTATTYSGNISVTGGGIATVNVAVTGTGATACSGTPTAGTVSPSPTSGSSATTFTLSLTGASALGGLTYQWQSASTSGGTYTDITGATNATYVFSGLSATTYYKCVVTCTAGGSPATATFGTVTFTLPTASCTPVSGNPAASCTSVLMRFSSVGITGESGTSIADATACNSTGYLNQTGLSCTLNKASTYTMTVTTGTSNPCYTQFWIDFNSDGTFQSTESVGGSSTSFTGTRVITIAIPTTVPSGTFRMRGIMSWQSNSLIYPNIDPCLPASQTYGEGRDYTVRVQNPGPICSTTPTSLDFGTILTSSTSSAQSNAIAAYFMTPTSGNITVTAPSNYQVCSTVGGTYASSYTIAYTPATYSLGTLSSATIYTKFVAPASVGTYAGNITITGGGLSGIVIPVAGISANPCTGTPAAGTASATPSSGISGTTFALSLAGASAGLSISYQWQSSTTGTSGTYSNISGATNPSYSGALTTSTYFQCVVTCGNSGISSSSTVAFVPVWCQPAFASTSGCSMTIIVANASNHFKLNGSTGFINDSGACGTNYSNNYATMSCTLNSGTSYSFTTGGGGSIGYGVSVQIWIDFNNDGTFQSTESVGGISSYNATTAVPTGTITIPAGSAAIAPGTYRMRVEAINPGTGYPGMNPCPDGTSTYSYGEVRDYRITLNVPPIGSVTPTSMAFPITTIGASSAPITATVSGIYLTPATGALTVTAPTLFEVFDGGSWVSSYTISYYSSTASASIQARFSPVASATSSGNITITGGGLSTLNIAVTGTGATACSGTPAAGVATASPGSGGASTTITLTCSGYSTSGGLLFQWQSTSDTTTAWTDIGGATTAVYAVTGITSNIYFRCNVTCSVSSITSSTPSRQVIFLPPSSCTPTCSNPTGACSSFGLYIASTTNHLMLNGAIGSINDGGACTGTGYVDNSGSMSCTLSVGTTYTMTCGSGGFNSMAYQAWIDFNNDGIFQGSESVGGRTTVTTAAPTFTITIPTASSSIVVGGTYRLRVAGDFSNNYPSLPPCPTSGTSTYGEVRDYRVTLNSTPVATVTPASMAFSPTTVGSSSSPMSSVLTAAYLVPSSGTFTVTAPSGFDVYDGSSWTSSYTISYSGASLSSATIQVRFSPSAATSYSANVAITGGGIATTNIAVTGMGAAICSGTPTAGTSGVSVAMAGATTPITLTCTGYTVSGGIQFQWQSTADTTAGWSNIGGATLASYSFTGITANTYYRCQVTCSASAITTSTSAAFIRFFAVSSCTPSFVNYGCAYGMVVATPTNHFRLNGSAGSIDDANVCSSSIHYRDFTSSLGCTLTAGASYTATCGNGGGNPVSYQIWIDFNNDGTFQSTESVGGNAGSTTATAVMTCALTIPSGTTTGVVPGIFRMRVVSFYYYSGTYPSIPPCPNGVSPSNYGEVRDYAITLNVPPIAVITPATLSFPTTTVSSSSSPLTSVVTGSYLTPAAGTITVTAPTGYTVFDGSSYVGSYTISYTAATLAATTISVRFNPTAATTYTGNVTITGGGLSGANIAVNGTGSSSCSGTPTAGTATCTPATGSSATVFTIGLTGTTVAGGLTYQWQSCATPSGTYAAIAGATNTTYSFSGLAATTYYNCVVTCSTSGLSNTATYDTATYIFPAASCTPAPTTPSCGFGMAMTSFALAGALSTSIADGSGCSGTGYQDRTALSCTLYKSYSYNTTLGFSSGNPCITQFWIDFNGDGTFQTTESVGGTNTSFSTTTNITLTIPSGVTSGVYRMRSVLTFYGSGYSYPTLNPCMTSYTYGEARDYKVNITDAPPLVTAYPTTIAFGGVTAGTASPAQSFSMVGAFLVPTSGTLTVTAPANYSVCSTLGGTYAGSYTVAYTGGTLSSTNVFVKFNPPTAAFYGGTVQISGGGLASSVNVSVNGTGASACSGTPTAGTAVVTPSTGTISTLFALSLTGTTTAGGLTYQWQSSSTGYTGSYTNISGATSPTYYFTGISSNKYFQCIVTCPTYGTSTSTVANATFVLPTPCSTPITYGSSACSASMGATIQGYFLTGYLGSFSDVLACDNTGYRDRTSLAPVYLVTGSSYNLTLSTTSVSPYNVNGQIWIDFNGDGTFQTTESVGGGNSMTGPANNITLTIPSGVGTGILRMRALVTYGSGVSYPSLNPCGGYNYGEIRDYKIIMVSPVSCSGTPAPGPLTSSATSGCSPVASLLSMPDLAGISGLTYQWQASTTGAGGSYTNISGATGYTYSSSSTANAYYICSVTCTGSASTANSGSQFISVTPSPGAITGTTAICVGATTTLSNSLSGGTWSTSASGVASVNPSTGLVRGMSAGSCTISYTTSGCSPATSSFTVNGTPGAISGFTSLCVGGSSTLTNPTAGGSWSSANTAIATVVPATGVVTAVATGTTTITYSNGCGTAATTGWTTNVSPLPITGPGSICVSSTGTFTDSVSGGTWSNSPTTVGTIGASTGVFTTSASTGTSVITYTIGYCSITANISVGSSGPAAITGPSIVCANNNITLSDATTGGSWSSSSPSVASVNSSGTVYGITSGSVTITYSTGCSSPATQSVTVNGSPIVITSSTACSQSALSMNAGTGAGTYTYSWSGPLSFTSTAQNPGISNASTLRSGIYSVSATQSGCVTSKSYWVTVDSTPQVNVTASPAIICPGGTSNLTDVVTSPLAGSSNYVAYAIPYAPISLTSVTAGPVGDNVNATATLPFSFDFYGTSYSSMNISTNGYINFGAASTTFTASALPSAVAPLAMIAPFWHNLNAAGGSISYATVGTAPYRTFVVKFNGVADASGGGTNSGQIALYETSNIIEMFISQANTASTYLGVCGIQNAAGSLAVTVPGQNNVNYVINNAVAGTGWRFVRPSYTYSWSPATGLSSTVISSPVSTGLTATQIYTVVTKDVNSGCTAGKTSPLTVNVFLPTAYTMAPANGCSSGTAITLPSSETLVSYQLYRNGSTAVGSPVTGTGSSISFGTQTIPGIYTIVGTVIAGGCTQSMSGSTTIYTSPSAYAVTGGDGCTIPGIAIALSGSTNLETYRLYSDTTAFGSPVTGTGSGISFGTITTAGNYTVIATDTSGYCRTTMTGGSVINQSPTAYNVTGGSGCSADGLNIGQSGSDTGVSYRLYNGASAVAGPWAGTGSSYSWGVYSTPGTYTIVGTSTGAGACQTTMSGSASITASPTITLAADTLHVCQPYTSASLNYSATTGSPTTYSLTWDAAALTAGFSSVTSASLPGSTIAITVPGTAVGTFRAVFTVGTGSCLSVADTITLNVYAAPAGSITSAVAPCVGYATNIVFTGTSGATLAYKIDGGTILNATLTGGTFSLSTGAITSAHTYTLYDVHNPACGVTIDSTITVTPTPMQWTGTVSTDWNNTANWSCGFVPGASDDVTVPSGTTFLPDIAASASGTVRNLTIGSGVVITLNSGSTLNTKGNLVLNGTITGSGLLTLNGTSAQIITGIGTVNNFDLNNSTGATVGSSSKLTIKSTLGVTAGALATGDSVVLYSDSIASARVLTLPGSGSSITGNVRVMQYLPGGFRRYRFWSHPFSNYIGLSQIQNNIDVTGVGGSSNGFTTTASNAPSAFRYNPNAGNSALPSDPGWRPFTSTFTTDDSNRIHKYQGIRVFFRGAKGEGLGYAPYTPGSATVTQWGALNQGDQTISLAKGSGANQDYNMVGNPYASPVNIGTVITAAKVAGNIAGGTFYIWNPYLGTAGQFMAILINTTTPTPYYIQANTCFQVRAAHNNDTLNFTEGNKNATSTYTLLKAMPEAVSLTIYDANYHPWDMLNIHFNQDATEENDDVNDGTKLSAPDFGFFSVSADKKDLCLDVRPYEAGKVIPLGIKSDYEQDFIMKTDGIVVPGGAKLYLHDKLLKQYVLLQQGTEYRFSVSKDKATQGRERFELSMEPATQEVGGRLHVTMVPNPATDEVKISFTGGKNEAVAIRVLDIAGTSVYNKNLGAQTSGMVKISLSDLAAGIYMVELTSGNEKVVERLIKE